MKFKVIILSLMILVFNSSCMHKQEAGTTSTSSFSPKACVDSVCQIKVEGYPQEVAVLIPAYADFKQVTVFFHGFSFGKERDKDLSAIMNDFEVAKSFKEAKTKRILVIPFSAGQNVDYRKLIKNKLDLQVFLASVYKSFGIKVMVEDAQLIAHSGAFLTVQDILKDKSSENENLKISQVTMLDATYSKFEPKVYTDWLKSGGDNKMTVIYLKNSPTEKMAMKLWGQYSGQKPGKEGGINLGNADYLTMIPEAEVRNQQDAHWLLVRKWFGRVL